MINIAHALSPFTPCPFDCPFCCARDNETNSNITLANDYWENLEISIAINEYDNIMLTGDTEPTLFPDWLSKITKLCDKYKVITELRTHNYNYIPEGILFNQVWYSITDTSMIKFIPELITRARHFTKEINFAFLINKDFKATEIVNMRRKFPDSKFTVRYLIPVCGSPSVVEWIKTNRYIFDKDTEKFLEMHDIRIKRNYMAKYDIIRQDGKVYHEWQ